MVQTQINHIHQSPETDLKRPEDVWDLSCSFLRHRREMRFWANVPVAWTYTTLEKNDSTQIFESHLHTSLLSLTPHIQQLQYKYHLFEASISKPSMTVLKSQHYLIQINWIEESVVPQHTEPPGSPRQNWSQHHPWDLATTCDDQTHTVWLSLPSDQEKIGCQTRKGSERLCAVESVLLDSFSPRLIMGWFYRYFWGIDLEVCDPV